MLYIYCPFDTPRLQYTLRFVFGTLMGCAFTLTRELPPYNAPRIDYGISDEDPAALSIPECGLLQENHIRQAPVDFSGQGESFLLFPANGYDYPMDLFSAVFYLITRYEEYLPFNPDEYQRYPHKHALAFEHGFLNLPLINIWVSTLSAELKARFPALHFQPESYSFQTTFDVDMAWSYLHKGLKRNLAGWIKQPSVERLQVLMGKSPDPFFSFPYLERLHQEHNIKPIFFWLMAARTSALDKNISPTHPAMQQLIRDQTNAYHGIHPSFAGHDDEQRWVWEKQQLEKIIQADVVRSRQHYLRFTLPETYRSLINMGISDDYSMAYGSINGFRASTGNVFNWFDLQRSEETALKVHPFCFMDANSFYEQLQHVPQTIQEAHHYISVCKQYNTPLSVLFHNQFLGSDKSFAGWKDVYEYILVEAV